MDNIKKTKPTKQQYDKVVFFPPVIAQNNTYSTSVPSPLFKMRVPAGVYVANRALFKLPQGKTDIVADTLKNLGII